MYERPDNLVVYCLRYGIEKCDSDEKRPIEIMKRAARVGDWATIVELLNVLASNGKFANFNLFPFQSECAILHVGIEDCSQRLKQLSFAKMRTYIVYFICWCGDVQELESIDPDQILERSDFFIWRLIWNGREYGIMPLGQWAVSVLLEELGNELREHVARGARILLLQYGYGTHRDVMKIYEEMDKIPNNMTVDEYELYREAQRIAEELEKRGNMQLASKIREKIRKKLESTQGDSQ